jgi:methionyl-tRNA synthetase
MSKTRKVIVTSALPYANNRPHVGHIAGAYLPADIYVRFLKSKGVDVKFVCGSDDYGVAIMLTAQKEEKTPAEVAKFYNQEQKKAFDALNINFDIYGATSQNPFHTDVSQDFFKLIFEKGYFEKNRNQQFYDEQTKTFLPDRFVKGRCGYCEAEDQNGDQCENCGNVLDTTTLKEARSVLSGQPAVVAETVEWLLDLSRFREPVEAWLENAKLRDGTKKFVRGLISTGLVKRSMTRDISWGIPVPLEDPDAKGKVLYVWFDAPIGYISNTAQLLNSKDQGNDLWCDKEIEKYHFIGEDNTIFHCVIWIAMLHASGKYKLPDGVIVNNFLNIQFTGQEEQKMSKSRGTAVFIEDYLESGGEVDALRYYLTSVAPEKARTAYKPEDLDQKRNSELADVLGNLVNRIYT